MKGVCSFFGHRSFDITEELIERVDKCIEYLVTEKGVRKFLFGSNSVFYSICHASVTRLKKQYPDIIRKIHLDKYQALVTPEEKEELNAWFSEAYGTTVNFLDYDEGIKTEKIFHAGRASYIEKNREMVDDSEYCVFYFDDTYVPTRLHDEYCSKKSGTALVMQYAQQRVRKGCELTVINLFKQQDKL